MTSKQNKLPLTDPPDPLVASVLSTGIWLGLIDREDVVAWADHCIEKTEQPPSWMIDLSLSHNLHVVDVMKLLDGIGKGVDPVETCRAIYGFLPRPTGCSFDQDEKLAKQIYQITQHCVGGDWSIDLLREADRLDDTFLLIRDGTFNLTTTQIVEQVQKFLKANSDTSVRDFLAKLKRYGPQSPASS